METCQHNLMGANFILRIRMRMRIRIRTKRDIDLASGTITWVRRAGSAIEKYSGEPHKFLGWIRSLEK